MPDNQQKNEPYIFSQEDWRVLDALEVRNLGALTGITDDMSKEIIRELSDGINAGEGMPKLAKRIQEATNMAKTRATTIARTETINAAVDGARVRYQQAGITEFEYIAASDTRTCDTCAELNGKIFSLDDNAHMPPLHPNCRCAIAPIIGNRKAEILAAEKAKADALALKAKEEAALKAKLKAEAERTKLRREAEKKRDIEAKYIAEKIRATNDFKELESTIKEVWNNDIKFTTSVKNLDFAAVKNNFESTTAVVADFPEIKSILGKVKSRKEIGTMSVLPKEKIELNINSFDYSPEQIEITKERYKIQIGDNPWHPFGTTYKDTMTHEFGHIVEWAIIEKKYNKYDQMAKLMKWELCSVAKDILEEATKRVKKLDKVNEKDIRSAIREISEYANDGHNPWSEAMAEAFADYYANRGLSKDISKEIIYISKEMLK